MKKILSVLWGLMFVFTTFSQRSPYFEKISATEISTFYNQGLDNGKKINYYNTVEDYLHAFEIEFGKDELHSIISLIEHKGMDEYIKTLQESGSGSSDKIHEIQGILYILKIKLCFITNGKIYALTYEPVNLDRKTVSDGMVTFDTKFGDSEGIQVNRKNLYLYRRDDDGWKKASELIREDYCYKNDKVREFSDYTHHFSDDLEVYDSGSGTYGDVYLGVNGVAYLTFKTTIWNQTEHYSYNSILVFVPNGYETYQPLYFEPLNTKQKIIYNFKAREVVTDKTGFVPILTDGKRTFQYRSTNIGLPVLFGVYKNEYLEALDGLTIKYWDALKSNPEFWDGTESKPYIAGTLNFRFVNGQVLYNEKNSTIKLKQVLNIENNSTTQFKRALNDAKNSTVNSNSLKSNVETLQPTLLSDARDGKTYKTVKIGAQTWMAENLSFQGAPHTSLDTEYTKRYGIGYTISIAKNVCPRGWHLPSQDEWEKMFLQVNPNAKKIIKQKGSSYEWENIADYLINKDEFKYVYSSLSSNLTQFETTYSSSINILATGSFDFPSSATKKVSETRFWTSTIGGRSYLYIIFYPAERTYKMGYKIYLGISDEAVGADSFFVRCIRDE